MRRTVVSVLTVYCCVLFANGENDDERKRMLVVDDIVLYAKAEAYAMIGPSVNAVRRINGRRPYSFDDGGALKEQLMAADAQELKETWDAVTGYVRCTYAQVASTMLEQFRDVFAELSGAAEADRQPLLESVAALVETSKVSWRKAMNAVQSMRGVRVRPWFWQMLIYTNTVSRVVRGAYPGMSAAVGTDALADRVARVQNALRGRLRDAAAGCKRWPDERVWDLDDGGGGDGFAYPPDTAAAGRRCPERIRPEVCEKHFRYVSRFDRMLYRNHARNVLPLDGHEKFDPDRWLLTRPVLAGTVLRAADLDWENVDAQLDMYVKRVSDEHWVVRYPNSYFDAVSNAVSAARQCAMHVAKRNLAVCKAYWRSIRDDAESAPALFSDYRTDCTDVAESVGLVAEKLGHADDKVLDNVRRLLGTAFTMDVEFDVAIAYVNDKLYGRQPPQVALKDDARRTAVGYTRQTFREYRDAIRTYANDFPKLSEYSEVFGLFKWSFYT